MILLDAVHDSDTSCILHEILNAKNIFDTLFTLLTDLLEISMSLGPLFLNKTVCYYRNLRR